MSDDDDRPAGHLVVAVYAVLWLIAFVLLLPLTLTERSDR